jgi:hypothetical protein
MNRRTIYAGLPVLLTALLLLSGCQNPSDSGGELPDLSGTVSVSGSPAVGRILEADTVALYGTGDIAYQWIRGESTLIGESAGSTYIPAEDDVGQTVKVRVSRAGYSGSVDSAPVGPVSVLIIGSEDYTLKNTIVYFSLSQGKEIDASKSDTTEWDIAFEVRDGNAFCSIYTNSGETAAEFGSGGQGGVWFTGKTDFYDATFADRVTDFSGENTDYADYVTDVTRYQSGMSGPVGGRMNIMTYYGYANGDGLTEATAFGWSSPGPPNAPFFEFNKKAFNYVLGGMPPPWYPTRQVYIIRHADGTSYSKFQVNALRYQVSFTYILSFRFENLEE